MAAVAPAGARIHHADADAGRRHYRIHACLLRRIEPSPFALQRLRLCHVAHAMHIVDVALSDALFASFIAALAAFHATETKKKTAKKMARSCVPSLILSR